MELFQQIGFGIVLGLIILILTAVLVGIIFTLRILKNVKQISQKAEETTESFADIASMIGKKVAPVALSTAVAAAFRRIKK